jgi:hypothetical protein
MYGSRSKIPSKKSRQAALRGGIFNSGVEGLSFGFNEPRIHECARRDTLF